MAPPPKRWPLEHNEDMTAEMLLRIPPDEPKDLIRASVVCKLWLSIISDPAFRRRHRSFHRGKPCLLGFFYHARYPGFVPTTSASLSTRPAPGNYGKWVSDCRHGRILLRNSATVKFAVLDPFSNYWEELPAPHVCHTAVVLCAVPGCDHHSCRRGGPFHVVCLRNDNNSGVVRADVYSSESRSWYTTQTASACLSYYCNFFEKTRAAVIGDGIYFSVSVSDGAVIIMYDLTKQCLSFIGMPDQYKDVPVLMQNEDGSLGLAAVSGSRLCLWSTMVNAEGITGWVQRRVIELTEILPLDKTPVQAKVVCFAEGLEVFFISTDVGPFIFELKSGKVRLAGRPGEYCGASPFISFFIPDRGCRNWTKESLVSPKLRTAMYLTSLQSHQADPVDASKC